MNEKGFNVVVKDQNGTYYPVVEKEMTFEEAFNMLIYVRHSSNQAHMTYHAIML